MSDRETCTGYEDQAARFIAAAEQYAALGLPVLPDDPAAATAMRAEGFDVLAEVTGVDRAFAIVQVLSEDEGIEHVTPAADVAAALGVTVQALVGREFLATLRETPETGPVLSGFRPVPEAAAAEGREMTVRCLLLFGDQAELAADDAEEEGDVARWPAAAIAAETGLRLEQLPGKRFRAQVAEEGGRVLFSAFRLLP